MSHRNSKLFEYSSGRWIYNDSKKRKRRQRLFNVSNLANLAAESVNRRVDEVIAFEKLGEGGFNRTFLVTMQDRLRLVARIPYTNTEPRRLLIASEVATLDLLRSNGIPVPKVYGYSTSDENPAESEHISLEFVSGTKLGDIWFDLPGKDRIKIVGHLVELESVLFDLKFPACGSLYFKRDIESTMKTCTLLDPSSNRGHCIGTDTSLHLWHGKRLDLQCRRGPYCDTEAALTAGAEKELAYLRTYGRPLHPFNRIRRELYKYKRQDPQPHIESLQTYLEIARHLIPQDRALERPTLRHPDLQPNNIFVSSSLDIISVIDWQHTVILPLFLQCGIPSSLQNWGDPVSESLTPPALPPDFKSLGERQKHEELARLYKRQLHFHYFKETATRNTSHQTALLSEMSILRRKTFHHRAAKFKKDAFAIEDESDAEDEALAEKHWVFDDFDQEEYE